MIAAAKQIPWSATIHRRFGFLGFIGFKICVMSLQTIEDMESGDASPHSKEQLT
jgi:hypothetical protein